MFRKLDVDGSGAIEKGEVVKLLKALGIIDEDDDMADFEVSMAMSDADQDGSNAIELPEFKEYMQDQVRGRVSPRVCMRAGGREGRRSPRARRASSRRSRAWPPRPLPP